jgi:hypothetical protein
VEIIHQRDCRVSPQNTSTDHCAVDVSVFDNDLFPIEAYWGLSPTRKFWVPLALTDPALLGAVLFCSQQFKARVSGQREPASAVNHLTQTIHILNERFQDYSDEIHDSTIAAVAGLALTEVNASKVLLELC